MGINKATDARAPGLAKSSGAIGAPLPEQVPATPRDDFDIRHARPVDADDQSRVIEAVRAAQVRDAGTEISADSTLSINGTRLAGASKIEVLPRSEGFRKLDPYSNRFEPGDHLFLTDGKTMVIASGGRLPLAGIKRGDKAYVDGKPFEVLRAVTKPRGLARLAARAQYWAVMAKVAVQEALFPGRGW